MPKLRAVSRSGVPIRIVKMDLVSAFVQAQGERIITDRGGRRSFGLQGQVAAIGVGNQAGLVLSDGGGHSSVGARRNVWAVFQGGRRIR